MGSINNPLLSMLIQSTGNNIGDTGATSLSEALKSNTALTQLNLLGENKTKQKTAQKWHPQQSTLVYAY